MVQVFILYTREADGYVNIVGVYRSRELALRAFEQKVGSKFLCGLPLEQETARQEAQQKIAGFRRRLEASNIVDMGYNDFCFIESCELEL